MRPSAVSLHGRLLGAAPAPGARLGLRRALHRFPAVVGVGQFGRALGRHGVARLGDNLQPCRPVDQVLADRFAQGREHGETAEPGIFAFDDDPAGLAGACSSKRPFGGGDELVVTLPIPPIGFFHPPALQRIFFQAA